jgi:hypothetical protein
VSTLGIVYDRPALFAAGLKQAEAASDSGLNGASDRSARREFEGQSWFSF